MPVLDTELLNLLLEHRPIKISQAMLYCAAKELKDVALFRTLFAAMPTVNVEALIAVCAECNNAEVLEFLLEEQKNTRCR